MDAKTKILWPTADDLRQLIICDTDFNETGQTDLNPETMQRLEQLGWLAEGDENGEYALTASGKLAVRRALGDVVAFVQFKADRVGRTYIAGPMTGHVDFNYPAFNAAAARLRSLGIAAINPADHGVVPGATWEDYLRSDIAQLASCESIYFLPGWPTSRGALLEHHIATSLGMQLLFAKGAEKPEAVRLRDELRERAGEPAVQPEAAGIGPFLNDVVTAASLLRTGHQSKPLADRISNEAFRLLALAAPGKQQVGEVQGDGLPPLPRTHYNGYSDGSEPLYPAEQMREYALAASQRVGQEPVDAEGGDK